MSLFEKELIQSKLLSFFATREEVVFVYIFGSVAKGCSSKLSDIDIAVYIDLSQKPGNIGYGYECELIEDLQQISKSRIDLLILNEAPISIRYQVLKYGVLIYCRSESKRRFFHEHTMNNYLDQKQFRKVQKRYLYERVVDGTFGGVEGG